MGGMRRPFYGWVIVGASLALMTVGMGIVNNCYSLFIIPVTKDLSFSRGDYSVCQTIIFLCTTLAAAEGWRLFRRFGLLRVLRIALITLFCAYFLYSRAHTLPVFYLLSVLVGLSAGLSAVSPLSLLLRNWFHAQYGLAVGVAFMGSGLGGMLFNPLCARIIETAGWRSAFVFLALCMAAVSLPAAFLLIRETPAAMGLRPLGEGAGDAVREKEVKPLCLRGSYALLLFSIFLMCLAMTALTYSLVPHMQEIGYSATLASFCASFSMGVLAVGKVVHGSLLDRFGVRAGAALACLCIFCGLCGLASLRGLLLLLPYSLGLFFGCPYGSVGMPMLAAALRRGNDGSTVGHCTAMSNLGAAAYPVLSGYLYDWSGSYIPMFLLSAAALLLGLVLFMRLVR